MNVAPTIASPSHHRALVHVICQLLKYKIRAGEVHTRVLERRAEIGGARSRGLKAAESIMRPRCWRYARAVSFDAI